MSKLKNELREWIDQTRFDANTFEEQGFVAGFPRAEGLVIAQRNCADQVEQIIENNKEDDSG